MVATIDPWMLASGNVRDTMGWARACETRSPTVGTRAILVGLLRISKVGPADELLRAFAVPRDKFFTSLQGQNSLAFNPWVGEQVQLNDWPTLTKNGRRCLQVASQLREQFKQPSLNTLLLFWAVLRSTGTARNSLAKLLPVPLPNVERSFSSWMVGGRRGQYLRVLQQDFSDYVDNSMDPAGAERSFPLRPNFAPDTAQSALVEGDSDLLAIGRDVETLATLISSVHLRPPLAVGLFASWGTGKTFFLGQLRLRVEELERSARTSELRAKRTAWCSEIVVIEFNAWQYARGDLWASLMNRVFEAIRDRLASDERFGETLASIERQTDEVFQARESLREAHEDYNRARSEMRQNEAAASSRSISELAASDHALDESLDAVEVALNVDSAVTSVSALRQEVELLHSSLGRLLKGWQSATLRRKAAVSGLGGSALLLLALTTVLPPASRAGILVASVIPLIAAVKTLLGPISRAIEAAARLLGADDAQRRQYEAAVKKREAAELELARLKALGPASLYSFVSDRYESRVYTEHLGMTPTIREDLKRLTAMSARSAGVAGVDRVVIIIDDLDRCASDQVVRVLEAVHLLFGHELFVVVAAVDSRWLTRSIEAEFQTLLREGDPLAASPRDYLEKIIQLPFWLSPMRRSGFERLVRSLVQSPSPSLFGPRQAIRNITAPSAGYDEVSTSWRNHAQGDETEDGTVFSGSEVGVESLTVSEDEVEFISRLYLLVTTPRATKRFLNAYQMMRVLKADEFAEHTPPSQYEPRLTLLAIVAGSCATGPACITAFKQSSSSDLASFLTDQTDEIGVQWSEMKAATRGLPVECIDRAFLKAWLPVVSRFTFDAFMV